MINKFAESIYPINDLIAKRWSPRAFDINKVVSRKDIISICEAGRWAPSCYGDEPWRFIVWDIYHDSESYYNALDCIGEWNKKWVCTAPVIIASFADNSFRKNGDLNRWGQHDTGLATQNILLQAFSLGLVAHPLGGFDSKKIKEHFSVEDRFTPMTCVAIGYQADIDVLNGEHAEQESKPRFRRPLGETFFDGTWKKPIY
ncbi:nitroreductase family protein [Candidatus Kapaibacterium sp.]